MSAAPPLIAVLWFAATAAIAGAQESARKPLFGRALAAGLPLPRATVTLVGIPHWFDPNRDVADVVEAQTDGRGQFRAQLVPGLPYMGFCVGEATADGIRARGAVQGWFGAGAIVEFECAPATGPFAVRATGLAAWAGDGPLQVRARPCAPGTMWPLPWAQLLSASPGDGDLQSTTWPALPAGLFEVRTAAGVPLLLAPAYLEQPEVTVAVPPPVSLLCRVVDGAGAPIAGAAVRLRGESFADEGVDGIATVRWRVEPMLGRTAADGTLALRLPIADPFAVGAGANALFVASAAGHQERVSGFQGRSWYRDDRRLEPDGRRDLSFALPAVVPLHGKVVFGGVPAPTGEVRLRAVAKLHYGGAFVHDARRYAAPIGADGVFALDGVPTDPHALDLTVVDDKGPLFGAPAVPARQQANVVDLAAVGRLRVSVLDVRSGPAAGHPVYLCQQSGRPGDAPAPQRWCLDAAGRADLRVWPGEWFVFAADVEGSCWRRVTVAAGAQETVELPLVAHPVARGVLFDATGQPAAGAVLEIRRIVVDKIADRDLALAARLLRAIWSKFTRRVRTDAAGTYAMPFPVVPELRVEAQWCRAGSVTSIFTVSSGEATERLQLGER